MEILPSAVQCTGVLLMVRSNSFLSAVRAAFSPLAAISILSSALLLCPLAHSVHFPEEIRIFFRRDRSLLNCLFHSVRDVILYMFRKLNKTERFTPGFICVLHTFGRNLQWNPHIHVLVSEVAVGRITPWKHVKHFNYPLLRSSFSLSFLTAFMTGLALLSNKSSPLFTRIIVKAFMSTLNPITVIRLSFQNTSVVILADLRLLLPVSTLTPALMSPFTTTGMKTTNSLSKRSPQWNSLNVSLFTSLISISK